MVRKKYIPQRGDIVWLNFDPQSGHEQKGKQPAMVISPKEYNAKTCLGLFCPITGSVKDYPFEVQIDCKNIKGVVLADRVKSLDWETRKAEFIEKMPAEGIGEVIEKIGVLLSE